MMVLRSIACCSLALVLASSPSLATTVDLTTGTSGTLTGFPQSFNETRGVAVTVQGASNQNVTSMTLSGLSISTATGIVGARIYDNTTTALIASAQANVTTGSNIQVVVPISAVLLAGGQYRLCFFVSAGISGGSGIMFDPAPPSVGGFPYTESTGTLLVQQAYSVGADAFPSGQNIFVPLLSLEMCPTVPTLIDLTSGTGGTLTPGQSFNETRGIDFVVNPGCTALTLQSMTLRGLNISTSTGTVGARIYDSTSTLLLAAADTVVGSGSGLTVTVPISTTLSIGGQYRACFFVAASGVGGSGPLFDPAPLGVGGFPYTDSTGALSIQGGYQLLADAFPTTPSATSVCPISINVDPGTSSGTPYCFGDGSGAACPCGNTGSAGNGCSHSVFASGAHLAGTGLSSITSDTLSLVSTLVPNGPGLYFQGVGQTQIPFGDGLLCAGIGISRLGVVFATGNTSSYPGGTTPGPIHVGGAANAGNVRSYQMWFRDSDMTFCSPALFNLTNGLAVLWTP